MTSGKFCLYMFVSKEKKEKKTVLDNMFLGSL